VFDEHERGHRLEHADLDLLALAGAFAVEQRHRRGVQRGQPVTLSAMIVADVVASPVSCFCTAGTALGLDGVVVGRPVAFGPAPSVAVAVGVDDLRVDGGDLVVVEAQLGDRLGPHRVDEDVGGGDQRPQCGLALLGAQSRRHCAFRG
jgi:hypothetical protein